ncbi:MAG: hypothetical protein JWL60_287 [Gemmatimonadetes bacterium]|nr:hypothetical protein [Gemmatimonadota bacterium]
MLYHSLRAAAHVALRWYYADVVVQGGERVPATGRLLVVANHPNALVDALVVGTALQRRVLLTAKATLFEHPLLAPLLHAVGVVPLRRAADVRANPAADLSAARNADSFQQVRQALAAGRAVLVFPEGISHDQPALAPLKTGAARMALDAAGGGVCGLRLLPLGLVFERKERLRSRVLVRVGTPIDVDAWLASTGGDAARLTAEVDAALRAVTLNFASDVRAERAVALARALAAIADAPPELGHPRSLAVEAELAARVERATEAVSHASPALAEQADRFTGRVADLEGRLAERGATLADARISPRVRHGARFLLREGAIALLAFPVALLGRVMHWVPLRLARAAAMRPLAHDPSRDQPAMRTIVLGLAGVLAWYALHFVVVARWLGVLPAVAWLVVISLAAQVDFLLDDRLQRARERARTYMAFRRDPTLRTRTLREIEELLGEAVTLEQALLAASSMVKE